MTNDRFAIVGTFEVREFPKGWQHPRDSGGRYVPLFRAGFWRNADAECSFTADVCLPETNGEHEIAAYEAISEGTPASPAFPDTPQGRLDLINWCSEHVPTFRKQMAGPEAWAAILFGDAAILTDGSVIANG